MDVLQDISSNINFRFAGNSLVSLPELKDHRQKKKNGYSFTATSPFKSVFHQKIHRPFLRAATFPLKLSAVFWNRFTPRRIRLHNTLQHIDGTKFSGQTAAIFE